MRTVYGKEMPAHCAVYFSPTQATRRLHCLRLDRQLTSRGRGAAWRGWGRPPWPARRCRWLHVRAGAATTPVGKWRGSARSRTRPTSGRW